MRTLLQGNETKTERPYTIIPLESLLEELEFCRRKAERLSTMNELHRRLAGATDLPGMVEAFSVWLTPFVEHDLVAYDNPALNRRYMFCSSHGPRRQEVLHIGEKLFGSVLSENDGEAWEEDGYHIHIWHLDSGIDKGHVLLLRKAGPVGGEAEKLVKDALDIIEEPLRRALHYEELFEQASRDSLTGLPNRRVFESRLPAILEHARRHGHPVTLASMDLDRFKQVNDSMGHLKGDQVLRSVASTLNATVRRSDLLARMGGDEFLLVLPETDLNAAQTLAERLCLAVDRLDITVPGGARLGVSIGLVQWEPEMSQEEWLRKADEVLYHAKATGRSKVCTM